MNRPSFIYPIHLPTATASATDTASGYAAADVLEGCEDSGWKPANVSGSKTITIDLGLLLPVGQVAILGNYINGVTWELRGSTDNFAASDVQLSAPAVINSASFVSAYRQFSEGNYRQVRLVFTGMAASFEIMHVAVCRAVTLPFLADGNDPDIFQAEGTHLVGVAGNYLGTTQQRAMRTLSLDFGRVSRTEYQRFQLWAEACIATMRPWFYVPDTSQPECYFGWVDAKYKFSAPFKSGAIKLAPIPFTSRIA